MKAGALRQRCAAPQKACLVLQERRVVSFTAPVRGNDMIIAGFGASSDWIRQLQCLTWWHLQAGSRSSHLVESGLLERAARHMLQAWKGCCLSRI
jgi:hypothetical protein